MSGIGVLANVVDPRGLEPLTFSMSMKRSSQLSYGSVMEIYYTFLSCP